MLIEEYLIGKKIYTHEKIYWEVVEHFKAGFFYISVLSISSKDPGISLTERIPKGLKGILMKLQEFKQLNIELYKEITDLYPENFI